MPATAPRFGRAPGAWPLLGHVVALQRRPLALLGSLPAHGDLVEIRLGPRPAYVVCHPGLARQVLTDLRGFDRTGLAYERVRTAMGNGLASAAHADHRRQRLIMQPAFRREHLRGYVTLMRQEITAAMADWHPPASTPPAGSPPAPDHRASYLPFGAGATRCIGEEFGLAEATLILATTAARWNLIPDPGTPVSPAARAVLVPRTFPVHLSSR
jgi:cytochrome P450